MCVCVYGFSGGAVVKNAPANAGGIGLIPGSGRSPGVGNGNTLQYYTMHMYMYYILYIYISKGIYYEYSFKQIYPSVVDYTFFTY